MLIDNDPNKIVREFRLKGRVQGVGFRYHVSKLAMELNLGGFVRNELDGSVLIVAKGSSSSLRQLRQWLDNGGAPRSVIESIEVSQLTDYVEDLPDVFSIDFVS